MSRYLFYVIGGYLSGSVLYARVMCRLFGAEDALLQSKDANPGTSNAFAYGGFACGVLTLLGDLMKGILPVWLYVRTGSGITPASLALVLAAPVVGHAFPCFFGFRGGKAIAVSFGCLLGLAPFWGPVLIFAGSFIFFSVVVRITPHFQRTAVTYLVTLALFALTHQPVGIICGYMLISATVGMRLHLSKEPRERMQVQLPELPERR